MLYIYIYIVSLTDVHHDVRHGGTLRNEMMKLCNYYLFLTNRNLINIFSKEIKYIIIYLIQYIMK